MLSFSQTLLCIHLGHSSFLQASVYKIILSECYIFTYLFDSMHSSCVDQYMQTPSIAKDLRLST